MLKKIKKFCKNPIAQDFYDFNDELKKVFYKNSKKCLKNEIGNQKLAQKCINFYKADKLSQTQRNGINALMRGVRFLTFLKKKEDINLPLEVIDSNKDSIMLIEYEKELEEQYWVQENYGDNMDKEFEFYYSDLADYVIDFIYANDIKIREIKIGSKKFYHVDYGLVWNEKNKKLKLKEENIKRRRESSSESDLSSKTEEQEIKLPKNTFQDANCYLGLALLNDTPKEKVNKRILAIDEFIQELVPIIKIRLKLPDKLKPYYDETYTCFNPILFSKKYHITEENAKKLSFICEAVLSYIYKEVSETKISLKESIKNIINIFKESYN